MSTGININRLKKELQILSASPPTGIYCAAKNDTLETFSAQIIGPTGTPYENGTFELDIQIPKRYPFEPPNVKFVTPIYHPNIDTSGRICLDTLKLPPKGTWRPCLNLSTILMMVRVLMAEPGSEDPLMTDIWHEFKHDYVTYKNKAKEWTKKHATKGILDSNKGAMVKITKTDNRRRWRWHCENCNTWFPFNYHLQIHRLKNQCPGQQQQQPQDLVPPQEPQHNVSPEAPPAAHKSSKLSHESEVKRKESNKANEVDETPSTSQQEENVVHKYGKSNKSRLPMPTDHSSNLTDISNNKRLKLI